MILGIMQPYFFPYLGYFDLINCSETWIVFDTVQYIRHGWVNRNRILHPKTSWQYIVVPIQKHEQCTAIKDILISDVTDWRKTVTGQLSHYRRRAPYFAEVSQLLASCFSLKGQSLAEQNVHILELCCAYLGIRFEPLYFSRMDFQLGSIVQPGDWALRISQAMGASTYINPPGGEAIFDRCVFKENGIDLKIRHLPSIKYICHDYAYEPNLSIIDVLMWNSAREVKMFLDKYKEVETFI